MVEISFGLGLSLLPVAIATLVNIVEELKLVDSNAVLACVWCGAAFLPGLVVGSNPNGGHIRRLLTLASQEER